MKTIEKIAEAGNFAAISVGKLNELGNYVLELALGYRFPGKCSVVLLWERRAESSLSKCSSRDKRPVSCTRIRPMKSFISS